MVADHVEEEQGAVEVVSCFSAFPTMAAYTNTPVLSPIEVNICILAVYVFCKTVQLPLKGDTVTSQT